MKLSISTKMLLLSVVLLSSMAIAPQVATGQSTEKVVVYVMPYEFTGEHSQYTAESYATFQWLSAVTAGLLSRSLANQRSYGPELAEALPTISSDSLTYTFTLRDGLKFSTGNPMTADDVAFSYEIALDANVNAASYSSLSRYLDTSNITVVDATHITFTLSDVYAFGLGLFTVPIVEKAVFKDRARDAPWNSPDLSDAASAGAFMVESFDATNNEVVVSKNEHYWNAANVKLDKIVYQYVATKAAAISALSDGSADILDAQYVAGKDELSSLSGITEDIIASPVHQELGFNHLNPYFGSGELLPNNATAEDKVESAKAVRKAISHIINRDFAANSILGGLGSPAATIVPSVAIGWDATIDPRNYSIDTAKVYMEMAGYNYTDLGATDADGNYEKFHFNMTVLSPNSNPARNSWSALVAKTLPQIGIGVTEHDSATWADIGPRTWSYKNNETGTDVFQAPSYAEGGFDVLFVGYGWDLDVDPSSLYESYSMSPFGDNFYSFNNTEYDGLIFDYATELDLVKRINAFKLVQEFYFEWEIVAPIVYPKNHWAWSDALSGQDAILFDVSAPEWDLLDTTKLTTVEGDVVSSSEEEGTPIDFFSVMMAFTGVAVFGIALRKKKKLLI